MGDFQRGKLARVCVSDVLEIEGIRDAVFGELVCRG